MNMRRRPVAALATGLLGGIVALNALADDRYAHFESLDRRFDSLIEPQAAVDMIADGLAWSEGPLWDARTSTLFFSDGQCLFGPVLYDAPTGPAALRLWHAVTSWLEFPSLYELQRPKTHEDGVRIADAFAPYLNARDWITINRGEVVTVDGLATQRR